VPARTYSTDVYPTCPCADCEGRKVRITLRSFRSLSRLPSPACEQVCTSWWPDATTGNSKGQARWLQPIGKHPAGASTANDQSGISCTTYRPRRRRNRDLGANRKQRGQIGAREEASGGLSGTAMGSLDWRRKAAADDVQMVAECWSSLEPPTPAAFVVDRSAASSSWTHHPAMLARRAQLLAPSRVRQRWRPSELLRRPIPGGCTAKQRKSLVGGHLVGMKHPAERQPHRFADACVLGDLHHSDRPSATVTASRVNSGPRRSTRTWAPSARKATASASLSRLTSAGSGVNRSTSALVDPPNHGRASRHLRPGQPARPPATRRQSGRSACAADPGSRGDDTRLRLPHLSYVWRQP
jgi:hypothetical protein